MGLDDLIKHKHHHKSSQHHHDDHEHGTYHESYNHHDDHRFGPMDYHHHGGHPHGSYKLELLRSVLRSLPHKKTILTVAVIASVALLIIGVALLWALFPLFTQVVGYVEANGIKSIVDGLLPYVEKLWKGNG